MTYSERELTFTFAKNRQLFGEKSAPSEKILAARMRLTPAVYAPPGLYLSDFHWGVRVSISDYSGHGGYQTGTVE